MQKITKIAVILLLICLLLATVDCRKKKKNQSAKVRKQSSSINEDQKNPQGKGQNENNQNKQAQSKDSSILSFLLSPIGIIFLIILGVVILKICQMKQKQREQLLKEFNNKGIKVERKKSRNWQKYEKNLDYQKLA